MDNRVSVFGMLTYSLRAALWRPARAGVLLGLTTVILLAYYMWARSDAGYAYFLNYAEATASLAVGDFGAYFAALGQMMLIGYLLGAVYYAAVFRLLVRDDGPAWLPFQLGLDELRVLVLLILLTAIFLLLMIPLSIVSGILVVFIAMVASEAQYFSEPSAAGLLGSAVGLLIMIPALYFIGRFAVSIPLTIVRRRFSFGGWPASKGVGGSLLIAHLLIYVLVFGAQLVLSWDLMMAAFQQSATSLVEPEELARQMSDPFGANLFITAPLIMLLGIIAMGPTAAVAVRAK